MPNQSSKTRVVAFRLPVEVLAILERRVRGRRSQHQTVNSYLRARVIYDTNRKHYPAKSTGVTPILRFIEAVRNNNGHSLD